MQRYLITGVSGFVARHFLNLLEQIDEECEVIGLDIHQSPGGGFRYPYHVETLNLLDSQRVHDLISDFIPTRILHLASFSSVGDSWKNPVISFNNNTNIFLNLMEPVRRCALPCRILSVGSSEEYGIVQGVSLPLKETNMLNPSSPYGVARVSQEQLSRVFAEGFGMDIVMTRSFNHIGPGQRDQFVISSFVKQTVQAKRDGKRSMVLWAGNTQVIRDFLDVRDVVKAYLGLFQTGRKGEIYNICSGIGRSLDEIIRALSEIVDLAIETRVVEELLRPNELMKIVGSPEKVRSEIGWIPQVDFRTSLRDMVHYWDGELTKAQQLASGLH